MKSNNKIVIKRIPKDWVKTNKDIYVLYLGENNNQAGRRLWIPLRERRSLGDNREVQVYSSVRNLIFWDYLGKGKKVYSMKPTSCHENERWEVEIEDEDWEILNKHSITPSELSDFCSAD